MAEILEKINELKTLNDEHWFCPRTGADHAIYFVEDTAGYAQDDDPPAVEERQQKIQEAEARKWLALEALQIMAFEGEEAAPHKSWMNEQLSSLMSSCEVCVRVFHASRAEWKSRLIEQYDEEMVTDFLHAIDQICMERIQRGLDDATATLTGVDEKIRNVRVLSAKATYAFFEALSCDAVIRNEEFLQKHFDKPFELVQTKRRLKLQTYIPAMTRFLFDNSEKRQDWAFKSWNSMKRNVLPSEFDWTVRDHLLEAMMRVQMSNLDITFVPAYWTGVRLIVSRLDKNLISHSIRGLDGDFYRLLLDHLSLNSEGFLDLVTAMKMLLEKAPTDFWDAMDAITPSVATVVEQVFNSPVLKQILMAASDDNEDDILTLQEAFSWIDSFLASIKPSNLTPAARAFANALLGRFQSDNISRISRGYCFREGLKVLNYTFRKMNGGRTNADFVGQPTVNGMLDMLSTHIQLIVTSLKRLDLRQDKEKRQLGLSMIEQAFTLESQALINERHLITLKQPSPTETPPSRPIWMTILKAIDAENIDIASHLLAAGKTLIGVEPLSMRTGVDKIPATVRHFNDRFKLLSQSITDTIDRLAEFSPRQLEILFKQPGASSAIVSTLLSSTEDTRNSTIELLKIVSYRDERREALQHILRTYYRNVLSGVSDACRAVMRRKAFAPSPSMIRTCSDIIDVLCNSQDGILRSRSLEAGEDSLTMNFWKNLWQALTTIFATTEAWSNLGYYEKSMMMEFCRDTMQFADQLFDQCSIFVSAIRGAATVSEADTSKEELLKELLDNPAKTMQGMAKWLRLRDEFLSSKSVSLISKLLVRLHDVSIDVDTETLAYMENVLSGNIRAKLSMQQQAELQRALETHLGHALIKAEEPAKPKQGSLTSWMSTATKSKDEEPKMKLVDRLTTGAAAFQEKREAIRAKEAKVAKQAEADERRLAEQAEFKRKRRLAIEKQNQERAAAKAKAQQSKSLSTQTAEAGSGLEGLGVLGKDQAPKGEGLMHSSDESEDDGDFDEALFGIKSRKSKSTGPKTNIINEVKVQMPVKKRRVMRSVKDMRARLAPDLSPLHRIILGWDYFHDGDFPPKSRTDKYTAVPNTFRTPNEYQSTFEPLLTLEAWQGFVKAREESQSKSYEIRIVSRASVDAFQEVGSTMTHNEHREFTISEGDIVLLSKSQSPSAKDPNCLARVFRVLRKQAHVEVSYRIMPGSPLQSALTPNGIVFGTKIQSITPLEREYGALLGLQYYDLCDEIVRAKPSPLLDYNERQLTPLVSNYNVNKAQAKAIKSAIDNDAFTLIQGPPGSGKTKTITAIVGAILTEALRSRGAGINVPGQSHSDSAPKKLLVCAPSNAAVDELVMRFKDGIKTLGGEDRKLNIVRLGRSDAISANVQDVTLEELVSKRLGVSPSNGNDPEATKKLFQDHKACCEQLHRAIQQIQSGEVKGPDASKLQEDINALRRQKAALGTKIDNAKDNERQANRSAEISRRRAQESVLSDAHVICSTLSGSGHEMFQGLSIEFETVIVDEAAQCVEMSALIPLKYGCSKCILVGDPKQLPPTVFSKEAARFQYEQSLFVRMQKNHPDDVHLLDTQYRMHPEISLFPSRTFYDGKLLDGDDMATLRKRPWHKSLILGPYRFFDVQGQHQAAPKGHSLVNYAEINIAVQLYQRLISDYSNYNFKGKVGIITPYKSQLRELKARFSMQYGANITEDIEFNTTDAFQGRESEVIIFSCVRASPAGGIGFLQDIRRMNVGLTRAKASLWVLGNSQSLVRGEFWRKLIDDAKSRDRYTEGDLPKILTKPSSAYPAPAGGYDMPHRPDNRKPEPTSTNRSEKHRVNGSFGQNGEKAVKQEIKQEIKREVSDNLSTLQDGKRKASDGNIKMEDAGMEAVSSPLTNNGSGRSTPSAVADSRRTSTHNTEIKQSPSDTAPANGSTPGDVIGNMVKPKIRKRPKPPPDPFMKKPKRPKTG